MRFFLVFAVAAYVLVGAPATLAEARTVVRVADTVSLANDQQVTGDFYGVGGTVALSGEVTGDAQVLGGWIKLNGSVASDTLAVGVTTDVNSDIGDDLRIVGVEVTVASHVRGDLVVVAQRLKVLSSAQIDGDIIFFGGEAEIAGTVGHDIMGTVGALRVDGPVGGSVQVTVDSLTLGDRAAVTGNVQYASRGDLVRAPNAVVSGDVVRSDTLSDEGTNPLTTLLSVILSFLFAALVWYLFLRSSLEGLVTSATRSYLRASLIGIGVLAAAPFIVGVLVVSGLGLFLAVIVFILYIFLLCVAAVGMIAVLGEAIRMVAMPRGKFSALWVAIGGVVLAALMLVPLVGVILIFAAFVITLGALADRVYRSIR